MKAENDIESSGQGSGDIILTPLTPEERKEKLVDDYGGFVIGSRLPPEQRLKSDRDRGIPELGVAPLFDNSSYNARRPYSERVSDEIPDPVAMRNSDVGKWGRRRRGILSKKK